MVLTLKTPESEKTAQLPAEVPVSRGELAPYRAPPPPDWLTDKKKLATVRKWSAADANEIEFLAFIELCRDAELNPFRRQVYCLVFNKDDPKKRNIAFVVGIDGYRSIALRSKDHLGRETYLPMSDAPETLFDERLIDKDLNPLGLVESRVKVHKLINGQPWPIFGIARWSELAPIFWKKGGAGRFLKDGPWKSMPQLMLEKCAEVAALRRGWPEQCSGLYADAELERAVVDASAWELVQEAEEEARRDRLEISGNDIPVVWEDVQEGCEVGKFFDAVSAHVLGKPPIAVQAWMDRNRYGLQLFWSKSPGDALELKKVLEAATMGPAPGSGGDAGESGSEPAGAEDPTQRPGKRQESAFPDPESEPATYVLWLDKQLIAAQSASAARQLFSDHEPNMEDLDDELQNHLKAVLAGIVSEKEGEG